MLKAASASFAAAFVLLFLVAATGHLAWDNRLLWGPPLLFCFAGALALAGLEYEENRGPLLLLGAAAFCSLLGYAMFYVFLFGLVGH